MKVLILAGGTGGHVFPALAVAEELRRRGHAVAWMGAPDSFEARTVPRAGFEMEYLRVSGLRGKGWKRWLMAPLELLRAVSQASRVLARQRPDVVLGMGGFVAGPGGVAARLRSVPLVIHEQNAAAGLTNRCLARLADRVLEAFPGTFSAATTVGNPVRSGFSALPEPSERLETTRRGPRLLVVGGSQGARALNEGVPQALALIPLAQRPEVRHQAGRTYEVAQAAYVRAGVEAQVERFIEDMPEAYAWADLVVCRSGASTIAELCASGSAAILVPYPHAVDDHQTANARYLSEPGAAILMAEQELQGEALGALLGALLADRPRLLRMAQAARARAWPDATGAIVGELLEAAGAPC